MSLSPTTARLPMPGISLAAYRKLLYLLVTHLPVVRFVHYSGLLSLLLALFLWHRSMRLAFLLASFAWFACLLIPYLVAVPLQRNLIASRRLALVPHLPLASGLVLLGLATLLSLALPLAIRLCNLPLPTVALAPRLFVLASLYAAFLQLCLTSRHGALLLWVLPVSVAVFFHQYNALLGDLWASTTVITVLLLASVAGWARALHLLAKGSAFRVPFVHYDPIPLNADVYQHSLARTWLPTAGTSTPQDTLLLGFHGAFPTRLANMVQQLLGSPLLVALVLTAMGEQDWTAQRYWSLVLVIHLFIVVGFPWSWGELATRSRLLWLKLPGQREDLWRAVAGIVMRQYALMFGITLSLACVILAVAPAFALQYLHVLALVLAASLHSGCFGILTRLHHWSGWWQAVAMTLVMLVLSLTLLFSMKGGYAKPVWILAAVLLVLALLYYRQCRQAFFAVDWLRLKPLGPVRKGSAAA